MKAKIFCFVFATIVENIDINETFLRFTFSFFCFLLFVNNNSGKYDLNYENLLRHALLLTLFIKNFLLLCLIFRISFYYQKEYCIYFWILQEFLQLKSAQNKVSFMEKHKQILKILTNTLKLFVWVKIFDPNIYDFM